MSDFDKAWKVAKESEDDWIFNDWDNDKFEDGRPQWTMMQECPTCIYLHSVELYDKPHVLDSFSHFIRLSGVSGLRL